MDAVVMTCVQAIVGFAVLVGIGALLRGTKVLKAEDSQVLNRIITQIALPAFIFSAVYASDFTFDALKGIAIGWSLLPVMLALGYLVCRLFKLSKPMTGAVLLCVAWGNTGFIGYPLTQAIFGDGYMVEAVFYDLFTTVASLIIVGTPIAAYFGQADGKAPHPLKELATNPSFWALLLGLLLKLVNIPLPVIDWVDALGAVVSPLIMISVGLSLNPSKLKGNGLLAALVVTLRLVVAPLVVFWAATTFTSDPTSAQVIVLEAGTPTMMLTYVFAQRFKVDHELVAALIFLSVIACAISIPLMQVVLF